MSEILVVSTVGPERRGMLGILKGAGHHVRVAASFEEATDLLTTTTPDLVIADERLHGYNGMHLLLRARHENPRVGAIVLTTEKSCAVEADARHLNVECAVTPGDPSDWLAFVSRSLHVDHTGFRSTGEPQEPIHTH
jgi:DNA-binding NtrC family response regulator